MKKIYTREVMMFGCHFNGQDAYEEFYSLLEDKDNLICERLDDILFVLREIHGHNFKVLVKVETLQDNDEFVIYDEDIEEFLMTNFGATNYSLHPDFLNKRKRATCEYMSEWICKGLLEKYCKSGTVMSVSVYEHDDRFAITEIKYDDLFKGAKNE